MLTCARRTRLAATLQSDPPTRRSLGERHPCQLRAVGSRSERARLIQQKDERGQTPPCHGAEPALFDADTASLSMLWWIVGHGRVGGWPTSASQPFSTWCIAGEVKIGSTGAVSSAG